MTEKYIEMKYFPEEGCEENINKKVKKLQNIRIYIQNMKKVNKEKTVKAFHLPLRIAKGQYHVTTGEISLEELKKGK